jgi:hypothetical protein
VIGIAFFVSFIPPALQKLPAGFGRAMRVTSLGSAVFLAGCGGGGGATTQKPTASSGTPAGTYTITVTATSGSTSPHASLALVVQ